MKEFRRASDNHRRVEFKPRTKFIPDDKDKVSEWKYLPPSHESYCFGCQTRKEVIGTIIKICGKCFNRLNPEIVLNVVGKEFLTCCSICLRFPKRTHDYNILKLNVRLCKSCFERKAHNDNYILKKGEWNVNPTYLEIVKWAKSEHIPLPHITGGV